MMGEPSGSRRDLQGENRDDGESRPGLDGTSIQAIHLEISCRPQDRNGSENGLLFNGHSRTAEALESGGAWLSYLLGFYPAFIFV